MKKYSELKEKINIDVVKEKGEGLSYLTHYLHHIKNGVSQYYKQDAENFVANFVSEPLFPEYLNLKFDVPFPPKKEKKFTFIDLFAGIIWADYGLYVNSCLIKANKNYDKKGASCSRSFLSSFVKLSFHQATTSIPTAV